ncbi:hypothetical protein [Heyndrickxia oleronia]|nr:hypothetical protein [Heyndrickxia oleronia]
MNRTLYRKDRRIVLKLAMEYLPFVGFGFTTIVFIIAFSASLIKKVKKG